MVYKIDQRVKPEPVVLKRTIAVFFVVLMVGVLPFFQIISKGNSISLTTSNHPLSNKTSSKKSHSKVSVTSGSSHTAATGQLGQVTNPLDSSLISSSCNFGGTVPIGLSTAQSPELRKLYQYEVLCNGPVAARDSFFVPTPTNLADAQSQAAEDSAKLEEYASFNISPLVFMEPDTVSGSNIDLSQYASGSYDTDLSAYFSDLKSDGVTDSMLGLWVTLPEGNIPVWTSVDPSIYTSVVTRTIQIQKQVFPTSLAAIMLDSETYPSASSWDNGSYVSLLPYVQNIPKGLVDSFGLQGFPWAAPANQPTDNVYDPSVYLRSDLAIQAAQQLGVNNIWFNTGTFSQIYTSDSSETISATPSQRQAMLNLVLSEAESVKSQGFNVAIHLFAQDKSATSEAIDWSYWQDAPSSSDPNTAVFTTFANSADNAGIPIWLFDTY